MTRQATTRVYRDPDTLSIGTDAVGFGEEAVRRAEAVHGSAMLLLAINRLKQKMVRQGMGL